MGGEKKKEDDREIESHRLGSRVVERAGWCMAPLESAIGHKDGMGRTVWYRSEQCNAMQYEMEVHQAI